MNPYISVVIPVYNGSQSLWELCTQLKSTLFHSSADYEIILVDDFSTDDSWAKIKEMHSIDPKIKGFKLKKNFGQQHAVFCGLQMASYDYILTMDDDLQHSPDQISLLLNEIKKGYDVVYGVSEIKYHSLYRIIGSKLTNKLFDIIIKKPKEVRISSFRIMKKQIADKITTQPTGYVYISASTFKFTNNVKSINITHNERKYGQSNYRFFKLLKIFIKIYIYYSNNPICTLFRKNDPIYEIEERLVVSD